MGRSLGKKVGEIILNKNPALAKQVSLFDFGAIVAASSLAHDLGNPPFGHSGEDAISGFFIHPDEFVLESNQNPDTWINSKSAASKLFISSFNLIQKNKTGNLIFKTNN